MKSNIKNNFIYNSLYQILVIIIPLITTPYISRVLGSEGVGRYSYSYAVAYYFVMFIMLGLNNYGNRTIASVSGDKEARSKCFWSIYAFQAFVSIIVITLYCGYVALIAEDKNIGWIMIIYVISATFDINWFFFGMEQFKVTVARNSFVKILTVICIFIFVKSREDIYIYAFVSVIGMLLAQVILWSTLRKHVCFVRMKFKDIIPHIKPNLVLFIPVLAVSLYKYMDKVMLGIMSTSEEVGYYESCDKIVQIPVAFINALGTVMLPRISNLLAKKDDDTQIMEYLKKSLVLSIVIAAPMSFGIMAVAKEFVPIFYGTGFERCIDIFQYIMPSCLFLAVANVVRTQYLIPRKKDSIYIISVFAGAITNLIINCLLIPNMQAVGAAIGTLCAEAVVCIIQCIYIEKQVKIIRYITAGLPFVVISFLMYAFLTNFTIAGIDILTLLIIKIIMGAAFYGVFVLIAIIMLKQFKK